MVTLRLKREGTKDKPYYRVVATDSRSRRDGRFIESVGTYDPMKKSDNVTLDLEKVDGWIANGAKASDTVGSLIRKARKAAAAAE
ncbi:MAG: small subunit ribosomal protein S16 [Verrucomicrobiales bacterium]|jgi:small subunit ribosomal protein S16